MWNGESKQCESRRGKEELGYTPVSRRNVRDTPPVFLAIAPPTRVVRGKSAEVVGGKGDELPRTAPLAEIARGEKE